MKPEDIDAWLQILKRFSLAAAGFIGMTILLVRYWMTGEMPLPLLTAFAALLGFNALSIGREPPK